MRPLISAQQRPPYQQRPTLNPGLNAANPVQRPSVGQNQPIVASGISNRPSGGAAFGQNGVSVGSVQQSNSQQANSQQSNSQQANSQQSNSQQSSSLQQPNAGPPVVSKQGRRSYPALDIYGASNVSFLKMFILALNSFLMTVFCFFIAFRTADSRFSTAWT